MTFLLNLPLWIMIVSIKHLFVNCALTNLNQNWICYWLDIAIWKDIILWISEKAITNVLSD